MGMSEIVLIVFVALMLFGSKNIPEIARTLGKGMAQIKNATNDIKSEIQKSADFKEITDIKDNLKGEFTGLSDSIQKQLTDVENATKDGFLDEVEKIKEDLEQMDGPIKRQR
jgi:sec-independent protein translocase protein TatA